MTCREQYFYTDAEMSKYRAKSQVSYAVEVWTRKLGGSGGAVVVIEVPTSDKAGSYQVWVTDAKTLFVGSWNC